MTKQSRRLARRRPRITDLATREEIQVACHACKRTDQAERHTIGPFTWARLPAGWWALASAEAVYRCPDCLPDPRERE